jgi:hypothetical protein
MAVREPCPGCGLPSGRQVCQEIFNDVSLRVRALAWTDSLKTWRLMHDVYALQHPDELCSTPRQLVLHLGGVGLAIEHEGDERAYRALQQVAERAAGSNDPFPPPPGLPVGRGSVRVDSLESLSDPASLAAGIDRWARATWLAWAPLQPLAREWIQQALALVPGRRS